MEEDRRRHVQKVFAFAPVVGFRLRKVILDHPASGSVRLADTTSPSRISIPSSGLAMPPPIPHQEPDSDLRQERAGSMLWWQRKSSHTLLPQARRSRYCVFPSGPRYTSSCRLGAAKSHAARHDVHRVKQSCCAFDGEGRDPPDSVEIGTI